MNHRSATTTMITVDGNEAVSLIAHQLSEVIAIYPITPSSSMGELCDAYSAAGRKNIWGSIPDVIEMQSEGGAAGAAHGALQTGAMATTFTASQGLLLMIPNMYKIAGELTPAVFHVSARTVATHALSIFGDHSDVMAVRSTGWGMLSSNSVQEAMDFALISTAATVESRIPFVHFFDGFRTSHEVQKIEEVSNETVRAMIDDNAVLAHLRRGLTPDNPKIRGTAQNPDIFFQMRERANEFYLNGPGIVQDVMDRFASFTGRRYRLFQYFGAPDARHVIVIMGSAAETVEETVSRLTARGEKVGLIKVRLFRPFATDAFLSSLPPTVERIAVLDRTKEPGAIGEPLYQDVLSAISEASGDERLHLNKAPRIVGGRYGLSSKEFTPAMVAAVYDNLNTDTARNHFTIGITDDVSHTSIPWNAEFSTESDDVTRCLFYGLGSDGTVSANKNSIKIIGEETENFAQGYFVYDSKKAGSTTVSHLRFGPRPIQSTYLIESANFVACHQEFLVEKINVLEKAAQGATFLLNCEIPADAVWEWLPRVYKEEILKKNLTVYAIDAYSVARETGMGSRINTIMQTCFFAISNILPSEQAIACVKNAVQKTYGKKSETIVSMNWKAIDGTLSHLHRVDLPHSAVADGRDMASAVSDDAPGFVKELTAVITAGKGDSLPVSSFSVDGTFAPGTAQYEKRNIALEIPVWDPDVCIQCGKCVLVCPHASIRRKIYNPAVLDNAPQSFKSSAARSRDFGENMRYTIQVAPEDCTGCALCVAACPAKNKKEEGRKAINMAPQPALRLLERDNYRFFLNAIPDLDRRSVKTHTVSGSQFLRPLFEYSGACAGCGETPYVKLATQLFGDRMVIANATGCSSIYGGNLPAFPYTKDANGRGPAWCNSLFEDNAEFGLGFRLSYDTFNRSARDLLAGFSQELGDQLITDILDAAQSTEEELYLQRERVALLKGKLADNTTPEAIRLVAIADYLVRKSVWVIGGDGWAYDIGYGGLDHVLASGRDVNVLVLDTEVYSNTGGQMSKSTPMGAVAKFAASGKPLPKKDMGMIFATYGTIYVARVAMGYSDAGVIRAMLEADAYDGPSVVIAYSHCIAHGYTMSLGLEQQKKAVNSGHYPLFRYNPALIGQGKNPLSIDSRKPSIDYEEFVRGETRFSMLVRSDKGRAQALYDKANSDIAARWKIYERFAGMVDLKSGQSPTS